MNTKTRTLSVVAGLVLLSAYSIHAEEPSECQYDREAMLKLEQRDFDQDPNNGWRAVDRRGHCKLAAADLIRTYVEANGEQGVIMTWHEGQLRAMAGQTDRAIDLFMSAREPAGREDRFGWNYYVDATIAFLRRDRGNLERAREGLVALPRPEDYNPVDSFGKPVKVNWPPNLNVVDGLLDCFTDSYDYAYNNCVGPFAD